MYEQLSKELKASLFQRIKSPFFGSFLIGLFIFNYRFLLILLSNKSLEDKFNLIDTSNLIMNLNPLKIPIINSQIEPIYLTTLIYPFLFALFYIGIVPFFEYYISMPIWKKHQNRLKDKYAKLEKEEIFLGTEKDKYLTEILSLKKEKNKLVEELTNIDITNESKINKLKDEIAEKHREEKEKLNTDFDIKLKENEKDLKESYENKIKTIDKNLEECIKEIKVKNNLIKDLGNKHTKDLEYVSSIKEKEYSEKIDLYLETIKKFEEKEKRGNKLIEELEIKIKELEINNKQLISKNENYEKIKNEFKDERYKKYLEKYTAEELNIFKIIYEFDIKDRISHSIFVDEMIRKSNIKRIACEHVIEQLIRKDLIRKDSLNNIIYLASLKELIYEIFNNSDE